MIDTELQNWAQDWRGGEDPLPDLRKKIRRQNLLMLLSAILLGAVMLLSAVAAYYHRASFLLGFASGVWAAALIAGGYALWVRRGAWKPMSQTTEAYVALVHHRAVAKFKTVRFSCFFLLITILLYAGYSAATWKHMSLKSRRLSGSVSAALILELGFLGWYSKRKKREADKTRNLLSALQNNSK